MLVLTHKVELTAGTIAFGIGTDSESGAYIRFAGDSRPMRELAEAIAAEGPQLADVPDWAIL